MAKRAKEKAAMRTRRSGKLAVRKESVILSGEKRDTRGAIVISSKAVDEIREFLDELTRARLVFAEGDRYLALALPWRLAEVA